MGLDKSLFISDEIHVRKVKLGDGTEHELRFKELPSTEFRKFNMAEESKDEGVRAASIPRLIAASLCDAEGKPVITEKDAARLKTPVQNRIFSEILEINGFGGEAKNG